MNNRQSTLNLVFFSMIVAIIIVMGVVPFLGFIPLGVVSVTIIHIPVIVAILYFGIRFGTLSAFAFGVISLIIAFLRPTGIMDYFFQNPLISVVPRILFGFLTALIYNRLRRYNRNYPYLNMVIASVIGSIIHSVLVLGALAFLKFPELTEGGTLGGALILAGTTLGTVSILEAVAAGLIAPPIVKALESINPEHAKASNEQLLKEIESSKEGN